MFRHLLVPLDGSPFSELAVPVACAIVKRVPVGGDIRLAIVSEPLPEVQGTPSVDPGFGVAMQSAYSRYLEEVLERARAQGVPVTGEVLVGPVAQTLAGYIKQHHVHLVVLTTHGRGGWSRLWLGSTATGLARHAPAPLLLLRPGEDGTLPPFAPKRVLIPLDGTGFGEEMLACAVALAGTEGVEYRLVQAIPAVPTILAAASASHDQTLFTARETLAQDYLAQMAARLHALGATCSRDVLAAESVGARLVRYLEEGGYDLVVMATHGRGGIGRFLIGSVTDKILRASRVPMLIHGPRS